MKRIFALLITLFSLNVSADPYNVDQIRCLADDPGPLSFITYYATSEYKSRRIIHGQLGKLTFSVGGYASDAKEDFVEFIQTPFKDEITDVTRVNFKAAKAGLDCRLDISPFAYVWIRNVATATLSCRHSRSQLAMKCEVQKAIHDSHN